MSNSDYIWSTFDINIATYIKNYGYEINNTYWEFSKKHNKQMLCFVFYQNPRNMQVLASEYINSSIAKFLQTRSELTNLAKQTKVITHDELLQKINAI
jgi:hypothetical protein